MKEDPIEKMVDQLYQLLDLIEEAKKKELVDEFPPDIEARLNQLELGVEIFKKINAQALTEAGISDDELKNLVRSPSKGGSTLERAKKLRKIVQEMEGNYNVEYQIAKRSEKTFGKKQGVKNVARARKKKFKRLGGDDWVPL
ncbi:MAG: hypothetical protein CK425_07580 [Parachlamydia sp.]|nr:MAG: hypothetical protein CK425_07580 [Parachlamydia sp.]